MVSKRQSSTFWDYIRKRKQYVGEDCHELQIYFSGLLLTRKCSGTCIPDGTNRTPDRDSRIYRQVRHNIQPTDTESVMPGKRPSFRIKMATEMKLTYFNARGRAEMVRLLFKLAGKEFIDNRVEGEEWQKMKPTTPKGQLPVMEVGGKMMCETLAIARFVAREYDLYGANNWEAAVCDMIVDSAGDVFEPAVTYKFTAKTEEEKAAALKKMGAAFESLEKLVASLKKGQFVLGDKASMADNALYCAVEFAQTAVPDQKCDACPTVAGIAKKYSEVPAIAEWIKTRPETSM